MCIVIIGIHLIQVQPYVHVIPSVVICLHMLAECSVLPERKNRFSIFSTVWQNPDVLLTLLVFSNTVLFKSQMKHSFSKCLSCSTWKPLTLYITTIASVHMHRIIAFSLFDFAQLWICQTELPAQSLTGGLWTQPGIQCQRVACTMLWRT